MIHRYLFILIAAHATAINAMTPELKAHIEELEADKARAYTGMTYSAGVFMGISLNLLTGGPSSKYGFQADQILAGTIFMGRSKKCFENGESLSSKIFHTYSAANMRKPVEYRRTIQRRWLGYLRGFFLGITMGAAVPVAAKKYFDPDELEESMLYGPSTVGALSLATVAAITQKINTLSQEIERENGNR